MMRVLTGTSGFAYAPWKGPFYPSSIAQKDMLAYYASRLRTVEINNTFYRLPKAEVVRGWASEVPADFVFAVKASQRITHMQRLKEAGDSVAYLWRVLAELGERLGPVLFQLPPNMKRDTPRLVDFLAALPVGCRAAFEFRNEGWYADEVYEALRARGAALCIAEDSTLEPPVIATADWGYLRLRREDYVEADLERWATRLRAQRWREAFVYFKHEDQAIGPRLAERFSALVGAAS